MQIGFIDFSKEDRNKILATLKLLGTQTALDELGIGVIRDAYADILFPGISTIQTRAKYFVLIPYLFQKAAKQNLQSGAQVHKWLTAAEDKLVQTLVDNSGSGENGIIGKNALKQKRAVKMRPSSIYWNGLRTFEIIRGAGVSISAACSMTAASSKKKAELTVKIDGETFDDSEAASYDSVLFSPLSPESDFEKEASILLTKKEAEFLAYKIRNSALTKNTLFDFLIKNKLCCNSFDEIPVDILPPTLKQDYLLARDFSDFIIGAHIRYNVIFSEYKDEEMEDEWNRWRNAFISRDFNLDEILGRVSCGDSTQKFCRVFLALAYENNVKAIDELIIHREKQVKGDRSKLCKPTEYRYNYDRPVHFYRLDFRFGTAKTMIRDIITGLEG
ncbi:MAG: DUF6361 family protein [Desulfuromonadaceae bacterium]|nr:DUF6361 family protein [Desulfuromonadaceae bacterium]